jgi:hypothetical protein
VTRKLAPLRLLLDLRLNVNLFRTIILPGMRMLGSIHRLGKPKIKDKIEKDVRRRLRMFAMLPWTSPNELVGMLIGDTSELLGCMARAVDHKSDCRRAGLKPDWLYLKRQHPSILRLKHVPRRITRLLQIMYGKKCQLHGHPLNRLHLAGAHNITLDPLAILASMCEENGSKLAKGRLAFAVHEIGGLTRVEDEPGRVRRGRRPRRH